MKKDNGSSSALSDEINTIASDDNIFTVGGRSFITAIQKKGSIYEGLVSSSEADTFPSKTLTPPYDPKLLYTIFENSSLLLPNISAYEANIDGMGYRFTGKVDVTTQDVDKMIRDVLFEDELLNGIGDFTTPEDIPEDVVEQKTNEIRINQHKNRVRARAFFRNCTYSKSFVFLRRQTRRDLEVTGNAYWEAIRDADGDIQWFKRIPPNNVRITKLSNEVRKCKFYNQKSTLTVKETELERKVRSYAVIVEDKTLYCKEFNCLDIISAKTGKYYEDAEQLQKEEGRGSKDKVMQGNEIIHFSLESNIQDPYGVPRWIGCLPDVLGSRNASLYNYSWFEEGVMSPVVIMVSGGTLAPTSIKKLKEFVKGTKGIDNAHKILILEATSKENKQVPTIEFDKLKENETDSKWQEYDSRNMEKLGLQFRLPAIVRGKTGTTYSRSTAESALKQADVQVFEPERKEFDYQMNKVIMPELGFTDIEFVSNGYTPSDSESTGKLIALFVEHGILTPSEARQLSEDVFQTEFNKTRGSWGDYPLQLLLSGLIQLKEDDNDDIDDNITDNADNLEFEDEDLKNEVDDLIKRVAELRVRHKGLQARSIQENMEDER